MDRETAPLHGRVGGGPTVSTGMSASPRRKTLVRQHATEENSPPAHAAAAASVSPAGSFCSSSGDTTTTRRSNNASAAIGVTFPHTSTTSPTPVNYPRGNMGRVPPTNNLSISPTGRSSSSSCTASSSFLLSSPPPVACRGCDDNAQLAAAIFTFRSVSGGRHHSPTADDERGGVHCGSGRLPPVGWRPGYISHSSRALSADCRQHPGDHHAGSGMDQSASSGRLAVKRQKTADSAPSRVNSRLSSRQQSLSQGASRVTLIRGNF